MSKKVILIVACIFLMLLLLLFDIKFKSTTSTPLFEFLDKEELNIDDVISAETVKYTEGGDNRTTYTEKTDIESLYNMVKSINVGKETNKACEDNTTVYVFNMKDDTTFTVEVECSWLVIGNKRYEIVKD